MVRAVSRVHYIPGSTGKKVKRKGLTRTLASYMLTESKRARKVIDRSGNYSLGSRGVMHTGASGGIGEEEVESEKKMNVEAQDISMASCKE